MSYSVTLSLKVGGGQDEIILLGAAKIVTRWVRWGVGGLFVTISYATFGSILMAKMALKVGE